MKIAVTGASGFIGRNFLLSCPTNWEVDAFYRSAKEFENFVHKDCPNAKPIRCDFSEKHELRKLKDKQYDMCIYLAGNTDPQYSFSEPAFDLESNSLALVNFLERVSVKKLVYFSSGAVYHGLRGPVSPKSKLDPRLAYSISKFASEQYVKFFKDKERVGGYAIVRFFGAYGPYEPERKITTKLVKRFFIGGKKDFEIYGNGRNLIDLMYVSDTINAIHLIMKSRKPDITLDLANRNPITIESIVRKSASVFGVKNLGIRKRGVSCESIGFRSVDKTMETMGFKPKVKFEQGINMLAKHLSKH
ncbi:MAG: NAD(P)-dependent oxidoreductase [Candidatus Micrarchaeota archaeon]